jgi:hypothetical protein
MKSLILMIIVFFTVTQTACSFVTTAVGSFIGNVGADQVGEYLKESKKDKQEKIK